jgi:hypothetical protein
MESTDGDVHHWSRCSSATVTEGASWMTGGCWHSIWVPEECGVHKQQYGVVGTRGRTGQKAPGAGRMQGDE